MESTTNANQKEKFEGDLKKEIKKLQVILFRILADCTATRYGQHRHVVCPSVCV